MGKMRVSTVALVAAGLAAFVGIAAVDADVNAAFFESFGSPTDHEWVNSADEVFNGVVELKDGGFVTPHPARRYGASSKIAHPVKFGEKPVVLQYEVHFSKGHTCSGGYLKFLSADAAFEPESLTDKTPYSVMFGPDKCGSSDKVHLIIRYKDQKTGEYEEKHLAAAPPSGTMEMGAAPKTKLYTAVLYPDNTYKVLVDQVVQSEGSLFDDFEPSFIPPKMIDDPEDSKPADWVDEPKIPDPEATKPDDWDEDAPRMIPDPDATKPDDWDEDAPLNVVDPNAVQPEDWDEEEDGEWEAPIVSNPKCRVVSGCGPWTAPEIPNPEYRGKWQAPYVDNPAYKGEWAPRQIANPNHYEDSAPLASVAPIGAVAIEIWAMDEGIVFDNVLVSHDELAAVGAAEEFWLPKHDAQLEEERAAQASSSFFGSEFWQEKFLSIDQFVVGNLPDFVVPFWFTARDVMLGNMFVLYAVLASVPITVVFVLVKLFSKSSKPVVDDVGRRKKTDAPNGKDKESDDEEEEEEEEENKNVRRRGRKRA